MLELNDNCDQRITHGSISRVTLWSAPIESLWRSLLGLLTQWLSQGRGPYALLIGRSDEITNLKETALLL
jgi:hypothetical protein